MNRSSASAGAAAQEALRKLQANAIAYRRKLADGRLVVVERLSFGSARIYLAPARPGEDGDFWDYGSVNEAIAEAVLWNAEKEPEPALAAACALGPEAAGRLRRARIRRR